EMQKTDSEQPCRKPSHPHRTVLLDSYFFHVDECMCSLHWVAGKCASRPRSSLLVSFESNGGPSVGVARRPSGLAKGVRPLLPNSFHRRDQVNRKKNDGDERPDYQGFHRASYLTDGPTWARTMPKQIY